MVQTTTHNSNTLSQIRGRVFAITHESQKHNPTHHKRQAKKRTTRPEQAKNKPQEPPPTRPSPPPAGPRRPTDARRPGDPRAPAPARQSAAGPVRDLALRGEAEGERAKRATPGPANEAASEAKRQPTEANQAGSGQPRTVGVWGVAPQNKQGHRETGYAREQEEASGGPLNQPGGHWERAARCKLKGMGSRTVQLGVGEFH